MGLKILLVDDHVIIREALRNMLAEQPDIEQVIEAGEGREAVKIAVHHKPDIILMDLSMPGLNGIDATRQIIGELPKARILALSMHSSKYFVSEMLRAGASGFLVKNCTSAEMVTAIRAVASGKTYLTPAVAGYVVDGFLGRSAAAESQAFSILSIREREVLQLLAEGQSTREIADRLHVSISTVETHRRQIKTKLNLDTFADLVKFAIREGLTSLDT
jgi:DNA-binding NarL/FixJ family response regulator